MKKRIISSIMCMAMLLSLLPVSAFATGQYTLTYNENKPAEASAVQVENFPDPAEVTSDEDGNVTAPTTTPALTGYNFGGWYTDADCTDGNEFDFNTALTANATAYAKWDEAFTVTFNENKPNGVTDNVTGMPETLTADADGNVTTPTDEPALAGYNFGGWYTDADCTDGNEFDFDTALTANATAYAKWDEAFTVTFNENKPNGVTDSVAGVPETLTADKDGYVTAPTTTPTLAGYNFGGWYTEASCENEFDFTAALTENATAYALWNKAYTVTFNANKPDGITADVAGLPSTGVANAENKVTAPTTDPTLEGYGFGGWFTEASCENEFDFSTVLTEDIVLYAKWTALAQAEVETKEPTVNIDASVASNDDAQAASTALTGADVVSENTLKGLVDAAVMDGDYVSGVTADDVADALKTANSGTAVDPDTIEVTVVAYMKIDIKAAADQTVGGQTIPAVTYDIKPVYDVVATGGQGGTVEATISTGNEMTIEDGADPIEVTLPLPAAVVTAMEAASQTNGWYVKHEHGLGLIENIKLTITGNNATFSVSNFSDMTLPLAVETVTVTGLGDLSSLDVGKDLTKAPYYTGNEICTGWTFADNAVSLFDGAAITALTQTQFDTLKAATAPTATAVTVAKAGTLSIAVSSDGTISGDTAGDGNSLKYYIVSTDPAALLAAISVESTTANVESILGVSAEASKPTLTDADNGKYLVVVEFNGENKAVNAGSAQISIGGGSADTPTGGGGGGGGVSSNVTVSSAANGKVTVTPTAPAKGATVTITLTPDTGYVVDTVTVTDSKGSAVEVSKTDDTHYTFVMPDGRVTVRAAFKQADVVTPPTTGFSDVAADAYYADAVKWAVEQGITNGLTAATFGPDNSCTRGQMVTFLWRAAGSPAAASTNSFSDVASGEYYYDAVLWAVEKGITNGTSATTFSPNAAVNRGQTVTFLYRYAESPAATGESSFTDVAADAYYADAVKWAVAEGITNGTSATTFAPASNCTRGQIVTFMYRQMAE